MWTDTHLHLDAAEYDPDRSGVIARARELNVNRFVLPTVCANNFTTVKTLAHRHSGAVYCLGIHPMYVQNAHENDLELLEKQVIASLSDPLFAGIGEIGLDGFISNPDWEKQTLFFHTQLKLARELNLPVVLHVRKAQDLILKGLRKYTPPCGIAHAFNGSFQQAELFLNLNMKLGFGGTCTFTRALQLRRLVAQLPDTAIVLETDGPDMAPEWINKRRNEPLHISAIANVIAQLRGIEPALLSRQTQINAENALPALAGLGTH